jgi:transcriptional regulator of acetoin/glycerol metabolism
VIDVDHLPEAITSSPEGSSRLVAANNRSEAEVVAEAMQRAGGKKIEAARLLGISRQALWKKLKKLDIKPDYRR